MISKLKLSMNPSQVREFAMDSKTTKATLNALGVDCELNNSYAMDAAIPTITTPSVTTPLQFLQHFLPKPVRIVTAARKIDTLIGRNIVGAWEDEEIVTKVVENTGSARPYGDAATIPLTNFNMNYEKRTVVRFEEGMEVTTLEEARAARAQISASSEKREAVSRSLAIELNRIGFYGYNDGENRTYGFLNDPNLPAYTTVATGASGSTNWSSKTYKEICADIRTAVAVARVRSGDLFDPYVDSFSIAISLAAVEYLSTVTDYGISVRQWIKETYPKCRIVSAIELDRANGGANVFYLYVDKIEGTNVFDQNVVTVFKMLGVEKKAKGYLETYSNATSGVILNMPIGVVRYSGI